MPVKEYLCELCNNTRFIDKPALTKRLGADHSKHGVVKCAKCGHFSLYPLPTIDDFSWIYSNYAVQGDREKVEKERINTIYPDKLKKIISHFDGNNNISLLDIGAGLGGFVSTALAQGIDATGIEYEEKQVALAKKLFDVNLVCDTIENFSDNTNKRYDAVHLHHVLEHLRHPKDVLFLIKGIISESGILIFEVPNQFFNAGKELNIKLGRIKNKVPYNPYHHLHFYTIKSLKKLLATTGYEIVEINEMPRVHSKFKNFVSKLLLSKVGYGVTSKVEVIARPVF